MNEMTVGEAEDYLTGLQRRARAGWEQARLVASVTMGAMTGKKLDMELPWDEEVREAERRAAVMDDDELAAMRERAARVAEMLNAKKE